MGHVSAYTNFTGLIPSYPTVAPHPFGTMGFLQNPRNVTSNSANPTAVYCVWVGTTRTSSGTHQCISVDSLRIITGDKFTPAPLTAAAAARFNALATGRLDDFDPRPIERLLDNPSPAYALDPDRGVHEQNYSEQNYSDPARELTPAATDITPAPDTEIVSADADMTDAPDIEMVSADADTSELNHPIEANSEENEANIPPAKFIHDEEPIEEAPHDSNDDDIKAQATGLTAIRDSHRYNLRSSSTRMDIFSALTLAEAKQKYGAPATKASYVEEIKNCLNKQVWTPIMTSKKALPSKMIIKAKTLPDGSFDKLKSRVVGGGHRQDPAQFSDAETSSPTASLTSMLAGAAIAARDKHHVMTVDFKAAYLNADMKGDPVEMLLTPDVADILVELDPSYRQYVRTDKKIAVRLQKALYGFKQSAMLWYQELTSTLEELGFKKNPYDPCSFTRSRGGSIDRILVYVDDLFITSDTEVKLDRIAAALRAKYGEVTCHKGKMHNYLGIKWDFNIPGQVTLSMEGYISEVIRKYEVKKSFKTPATDGLFNSDPDSPPLSPSKQELFHSAVMTLHYLAKRTRPDILTAVSWCATRVLKPTEEDEKKLDRILGYLLYTKDQKLVLNIGSTCELRAYVDSSHGIYPDGKSVTGAVIMFGDAPIYFKSAKQKIVTRSSTESELVGISDTLSQILWTRELLLAQGLQLGPAVLFQDNMSTIFLANKGRSTSERTRHIKIRYFFIAHYVETNEIRIEYMPTVADVLTKALHGTLFKKLSAAVTGRAQL